MQADPSAAEDEAAAPTESTSQISPAAGAVAADLVTPSTHPCAGILTADEEDSPWVSRCYNGSVTLANYRSPASIAQRVKSNLKWKLIQDIAGLQRVDTGGQYVSGRQIAAITLFLYAGGHLGWAHDVATLSEDIRFSGPVIEGFGFDTHQRVRVFYSDEVIKWLQDGRQGDIPNGSVIVKQMYASDPGDDQYGADRVSGWALMIRNTDLAQDGWLWYLYFFPESPPYNAPGPVFYAQAGNSFCLSCHAAADNDEDTFASLVNLEGASQAYTWIDQTMPGIFTSRAPGSSPLTAGDNDVLRKLMANGLAQFQKLGEAAPPPDTQAQGESAMMADLRQSLTAIKQLAPDAKQELLNRLDGEATNLVAQDLEDAISGLEQALQDETITGSLDRYLERYLNTIYLSPVVPPLDSPDPDVLAAFSAEAQTTLPDAESDLVSFPLNIMLSHTPALPEKLPAEVCAKHNSLQDAEALPQHLLEIVEEAAGVMEDCRDVFITADNCLGCHSAYVLQGATMPSMVAAVQSDDEAQTDLWDISPYGEWSTSMMGLAGRDPIFHAQLSWEQQNQPAVADQISNLCLRCHQAAGQRQFHLDQGDSEDPALIVPPDESVDFPLFTADYSTRLPDVHINTPNKWGALGRDGINCTVCHQIEAEGLGDPSTFTGQFNFPDTPGTIYGPYPEEDIKPIFMRKALGLNPTYGAHVTESELCGSCHTVITPILSEHEEALAGGSSAYRTTYEQTTYPEWLNSDYAGEKQESCQDCHMPSRVPDAPEDDETTISEIIANVESAWLPPVENRADDDLITPETKDNYSRHTLVGLNLFANQMFQQFPLTLGTTTTNKAAGLPGLQANILLTAREMQNMAEKQTVDVTVSEAEDESNTFDVTVVNKAGHKFPSGVGFRRAFIRFEALDADGNLLWASGRTNAAGQIVDGSGTVIENETTADPLRIQPGDPLINDEADVYIFEERTATWAADEPAAQADQEVDLSQMVLSTSFLELVTEVKDTRLLPQGWQPDGPYADVTQLSVLNTETAQTKPLNPETPGTRVVRYQLPQDLAQIDTVRATIFYQSIPPYYIQDRLQYDTPEIQRLYYMVSHLNTEDTAVDGWVVKLVESELTVAESPSATSEDIDAFLNARLDDTFLPDTSALVEIQTYRDEAPDSEERIIANLTLIQEYLNARAAEFNAGQETLPLEPFNWREEVDGALRWVFGFRIGEGPRKFSILTHLDTVQPGNDAWRPFEPRLETKSYRGAEQPFLIGRGAVDDKGPAVLALTVLEAAARLFDGTDALDDWTLEVSFDTAEETDMSMPFYIDAEGSPELGIVFDAFWCIRAEKGMERPVFSIPLGEAASGPLWIAALETAPGSVNQIPGSATARIEGDDSELDQFAEEVEALYEAYPFDDPEYRRAPLEVTREESAVVLTTTVLGAQHASVPYENRADGANPLVSLANFLAGLVDEGTLAPNGYSRMAQFMSWGWGTMVFGEKHPELLQRSDEIFQEGNGTTYALTQLSTDGDQVELALDIRYALGHHSESWDGTTQDLIPGVSIFPEVFDQLVSEFNAAYPDANLAYTTENLFAPLVRDPSAPAFQHVNAGYEAIMGEPCPLAAIGGGTDAKGHPTLIAAGTLFSEDFGPPINYHGLEEGAPVNDLRQSALILYRILLSQVDQLPASEINDVNDTSRPTAAETQAEKDVADLEMDTSASYEPLPAAACSDLADTLVEATGVAVLKEDAAFEDYVSGASGRGCQATAVGTGADFESPAAVAAGVSDLMVAQGWAEDARYAAGGPMGTAAAFRQDNDLCWLQINWEPSADADCPADQPIAACELTPEQHLYMAVLNCAQTISSSAE